MNRRRTHRRRTQPSVSGRRWPWRIGVPMLLLALVLLSYAGLASSLDVPPRSMAPYLEQRLAGHQRLLDRAGRWLAAALMSMDRGGVRSAMPLMLRVGARSTALPSAVPPGARIVAVASPDEALQAIAQAEPGDVITFEPGVYRFAGTNIAASRPGTAAARITVRAERPGTVMLEFQMTEGFLVSAPYWTFENLTIRGACASHPACEHAFHVVGAATHFIARNNTLSDFNAHFKVNGQGHHFPDDGLIDGNTLTNTGARLTDSPVTPIDLVAASRWTIRGNLIADFVKAYGNRISYGAFTKGGGSGNRFERNAVLCELLLRGAPGWRVGLSLGGGGSGPEGCRDGKCITEQDAGVIDSNLVASCSDDGIYVNRSAGSRVVHNTLVDTGGIVVRFADSSAEVEGNLVDGTIRSRDDGLLHASDNLQTDMAQLYLGWHPQRPLFRDPLALDLAWAGSPQRRPTAEAASIDLCGSPRPARPTYGAFEDFSACLVPAAKSSASP